MNEGELFIEREGWHLPGFDTSSWGAHDLSKGLLGSNAGIGFFVMTFDLNFPKNMDVTVFHATFGIPHLATIHHFQT